MIKYWPWSFKMSLNKGTIRAIWKHAHKMGIVPEIVKRGDRTYFYFDRFALFYIGDSDKPILGLKY